MYHIHTSNHIPLSNRVTRVSLLGYGKLETGIIVSYTSHVMVSMLSHGVPKLFWKSVAQDLSEFHMELRTDIYVSIYKLLEKSYRGNSGKIPWKSNKTQKIVKSRQI